MKKRVSIIVPVYRAEPYIDECVSSILQQDYPDIEAILVDDGSDDNCPDICDRYALADSRVRCIHKQNGGISAARKTGLDAATGDYILFVDSDDWIMPNTVSACIAAVEETNADVVCFSYIRVLDDRSFQTPVFPEDRVFKDADVQYVQRRMIGLTNGELTAVETADRLTTVWGKLYAKKVAMAGVWIDLKEIGSSEDALFNLYAFSECRTCCYIHQFLYCYRKTNAVSITRKYRSSLPEQWAHLFEYFQQYLDKTTAPDAFYEALKNRVALSMIGLGLNEIRNPQGFCVKARNLRRILRSEPWKSAYEKLNLRHFSWKWKVFFFFCKMRWCALLIFMLAAISRLKKVFQK